MKTFYIRLDKNGIIRDVIKFPHEGYIPVEMEVPLPIGINGGWYRWDSEKGEPVEVPELKPIDPEDERQRFADLEAAVAAILGGAI